MVTPTQPSSSATPFHWPPPVRPGEWIAVAAPASPVDQAACEAGIGLLKEWGFKILCDPEVCQPRDWGRETDRRLAQRFLEIWDTPEVKIIMGARGGYGSLKLLPHLDLAALGPGPNAWWASATLPTCSGTCTSDCP